MANVYLRLRQDTAWEFRYYLTGDYQQLTNSYGKTAQQMIKRFNSADVVRVEREAEDSTTTKQTTVVTAQVKPFTLTDTQYQLVCSLFHELNEEFYRLSPTVQLAYYERLYKK